MTEVGNEDELIADAQRVLGDGDPVLHAGSFGLQGFMKQTVGEVPGGEAAKRAAELQPMTTRLIVAVTATKIQVITWYTGDLPQRIIASFSRATTTARIKHWGPRRVLSLEDWATGAVMNLGATTGKMFASLGPDEAVLTALVPTREARPATA
jgi:hypothetical protein